MFNLRNFSSFECHPSQYACGRTGRKMLEIAVLFLVQATKKKRPHEAGAFPGRRKSAYAAGLATALALRAGSFSLIRADLPERSRR